jgi:O-antigen ligase
VLPANTQTRFDHNPVFPALIGLWAAAVALVPGIAVKAALSGVLLVGCLLWWLFGNQHRWLNAFFFAAILLPPLPIALGDSGPHIAPFFVFVGFILLLASWSRRRISQPRLVLLVALFTASLIVSELFAVFFVGTQVTMLSVARIVLFAIGPFILLHALSAPGRSDEDLLRFCRFLFRLSIGGALFACIDFYFQLPSPAGFGPQFIWLENEVLRRAQGLFYEASTLGNFCAFFLFFALVAFLAPRHRRPCSRTELVLGSIVLAAALVFSYSRASLLNLTCACLTLLFVKRKFNRRVLLASFGIPLLVALVIGVSFPSLWQYYWLRLESSFLYFHTSPGAVLSGRLTSWATLSDFAIGNPEKLIFGIGYKTLPYTEFVGQSVISDNTYLDLLIETGLFGLLTFLAMNIEMLRQSLRAARRSNTLAGMLATLFFCFWMGELAQMLSGDLITYWRVLPIYFCILGIALRQSEISSVPAE